MLCFSQTAPPKVSTTGPSSPAINGSNNNVIYAVTSNPGPVNVRCWLPPDNSICQLTCSVENSGDAVGNISVGFASYFPIQTQFSAPPDIGVHLEKSISLPRPDPQGNIAPGIQSFSVQIRSLGRKASFEFSLWTGSEDNRRACQQLVAINDRKRTFVKDFFRALDRNGLDGAQIPDINLLFSGQAKTASLFQPFMVSSDSGRMPVTYLTSEETAAVDAFQKLYSEYRTLYVSRSNCVAPVLTIEQNNNTTMTLGVMPGGIGTTMPPMKTTQQDIETKAPDGSTKKGVLIGFRPEPPAQYGCVDNIQ